ncbi:hypothetical protein MKK67_19510 [Methylobacterium sp. J-072]|uniref:hypothetical protein n=1 Tax=Methylobacterium sp. J-072 TaxID=2836651 RepID=UPI001FBB62D1|nr:hypothetical protein [Methylobacterium sp. J-072]MCJ2094665.1 hypothetical protein [Methylobacterium sp. J-072]
MSAKEPHYAVKFAERYGSATDAYLNAQTALARLEELIEDATDLKGNFDKWVPTDTRWAPWVGGEIISYYWVGFVTCLEWHARSRLVDLLTFKPSAAKTDDLRVIKEKVVIEMFAANVTLPSIVGAVTNVSNFDDYMNIFSRIFKSFDENTNAWDALKAQRQNTGAPWVDESEFDDLVNLYFSRNDLVHEIGITRLGHINVRDRLDPDEAIRLGKLVQRTMLAIEALITAKLPPEFPNLLDSSGNPTDVLVRIEQEIVKYEDRIGRLTTAFTDSPVDKDENWEPAKSASAEYIIKEKTFLDNAQILHNRYVEMREPLKLALVRARHAYLKQVVDMVGEVWDVDDASGGNP